MTFEVPLSGLKPASDAKTGEAHFQAGLVAYIPDSSGEVVGKVSRELAGDLQNPALANWGTTGFCMRSRCRAPGHYVIDTAVTDKPSWKDLRLERC